MKKEDYPDIHPDFLRAIIGLPLSAQQEQIRNYREDRDRQRAAKGLPPLNINSVPVQLPLWPEMTRGTPNEFIRSALFPAIQGKSRQYIKSGLVASLKGGSVKFTGLQLDQSDFDVWLQSAHLARISPFGEKCLFKRNAFLKSIGRSNGKTNYQWLDGVLTRLQASFVEVRKDDKWIRFNLIERVAGDDETGIIALIVPKALSELFLSDNWTALEWEQRKALKGKPLALWLHSFYASHAKPLPMKVETLKELSGAKTKAVRNFKIALKKAFSELETVAGFKTSFDNGLVFVEKPPTPSQTRYLLKKIKSASV